MTLTRPAYRLTITNPLAGWAFSVTQGDDVPDPVPPVLLRDNFNMGWAWAARPGSELNPAVASVTLHAATAQDVPVFDLGSLVHVVLDRPTSGTPIVYADWWGNITDGDASTPPDSPTIVAITITEILAAARRLTYTGVLPLNQNPTQRAEQLRHDALWINAEPGGLDTFQLGQIDADNVGVLDLYEDFGKSAPFNWPYGQAVTIVRVGYDTYNMRMYASFENFEPQITATVLPLRLAPDSPESLQVDVTLTSDPWDTPGLTSIPANAVAHNPEWRIGLDDMVNDVQVTGINEPSPRQYALWQSSIDKVGDLQWTVETQLTAIPADYPKRFLPPRADTTPNWGMQSVPVLTEQMNDDDLDRLAPGFWPHLADEYFGIGLPNAQMIAIIGIDHDSQLSGIAAYGHLAGADFTIVAGELVIKPKILPTSRLVFTSAAGLTWARLAIDPALNSLTWADPTELHPAPALRWDDLRLADL